MRPLMARAKMVRETDTWVDWEMIAGTTAVSPTMWYAVSSSSYVPHATTATMTTQQPAYTPTPGPMASMKERVKRAQEDMKKFLGGKDKHYKSWGR